MYFHAACCTLQIRDKLKCVSGLYESHRYAAVMLHHAANPDQNAQRYAFTPEVRNSRCQRAMRMKARYAHLKMVRAIGIFCQQKSDGAALLDAGVAEKSQGNAPP